MGSFLNPTFADEYERWLEWAAAECPLPSETWSRLRGECRQRDDTLFEVGAAYFLSTSAKLLIKEWSPIANGGRRGDFVLGDSSLRTVHVEVKKPSRKSQLVPEVGQAEADAREKAGEWYKPGDGGSYSAEATVRETIERTLPQLPKDKPTLLIITEERSPAILDTPKSVCRWLEVACQGKEAGRLGALAILDIDNRPEQSIRYRFKFAPNLNASPATQIPDTVFEQLFRLQTADEG